MGSALAYLGAAAQIGVIGAPLGLVIWMSLQDPRGEADWSLASWRTILVSQEAGFALAYSVVLGALIAALGTFLAIPFAYLIAVRRGRAGRFALAFLLMSWFLDPGLRILGWMQVIKTTTLFRLMPDAFQGSLAAELVAGIHAWLPAAAILLAIGFARVPAEFLAAARECGASSVGLLRRILWPQSQPWSSLVLAIVFCGATGNFLEPRLLGSGMFEQATEWLQRAMESEVGWPYASTMLILLLLAATLPLLLLVLSARRRS